MAFCVCACCPDARRVALCAMVAVSSAVLLLWHSLVSATGSVTQWLAPRPHVSRLEDETPDSSSVSRSPCSLGDPRLSLVEAAEADLAPDGRDQA